MLQANNETGHISPITLDHAWPKQDRLLFTVACSIFGCLMNGFFIAAFFINDYLKRIGLVFQASVGLSDMIISMGVIPVSALVLLSGVGDTASSVCNAMQFLIEASTYSYSIFFAIMSVENFYRLYRPGQECKLFISKRGDLIAILIILIITFTFAGVGAYLGLDYDGCYRSHSGNFIYRTVTNIIFHAVPCLITVSCSVIACLVMKDRANTHIHYRYSQQYINDQYAHYVNIIAYLLYVGAWMPFMISLNCYPVNDTKFYCSMWLGVGRSVLTSFLYGVLDNNFRRAYGYLISYLFCPRALSGCGVSCHWRVRTCRVVRYRAASGDYILRSMDDAANTNSPRRPALLPRSPYATF